MRDGIAGKIARHFWCCRKGATAIEFALVLPVFLLLLFGTLEFSLIFYAKSVIEGASDIGARLGKTGYTEAGVSREQMIIDLIGEKASGLLNTAKITVTPLVYSDFASIDGQEPYLDVNSNNAYDVGETYNDVNGNGQWDSDMGKAGAGDSGDIVVYKVHYPWHVLTPLVDRLIGDSSGDFSLDTAIVVRNEPY